MKSVNIASIIAKLRTLFTTFGISRILLVVCDNSPFNSVKYKVFAEKYDFTQTVTSPRYP